MKNIFLSSDKGRSRDQSNGPHKNQRRCSNKCGSAALGLLAAAALALLPACGGSDVADTAAEESNVTAEEVAENTGDHVGEEVTIRSTVEETVDDSAFLLNDDNYFDGEGILVINATGEAFVVPDVGDSEVQVTGTVETFAMTTVAESYGLTLDPDLYQDYETKPVIIAQSIALAPDPGEITADPEKFYNQRIAVEGDVDEIRETGLFTIAEEQLFGGEDLLVYAPDTAAFRPIEESEAITVTGVLRPFIVADFERDYDLNWDLSVREEVEAEYDTKPVFVADSVYPSAI